MDLTTKDESSNHFAKDDMKINQTTDYSFWPEEISMRNTYIVVKSCNCMK